MNDAELAVEIDRCVEDWLILKRRVLASLEEVAGREGRDAFLYSRGFYFIACGMVLVDKAVEANAPADFIERMNARFEELLTECRQEQCQVVQPQGPDDEWPELLPDMPIL